ncbi:MAG: class I SAM-dependent methyltransferase [Stellaceae bacterium]
MSFTNPSGEPPKVNVHAHDAPTSGWARRFLPLIRPGGRVLDLAAGEGRHTRLLLDHGFSVLAADRKVAELRVHFGAEPRCAIVETDLEDGAAWKLGGGFDGIVVSLYLHRKLFPDLVAALAPGGTLIYETFMAGNERFGRPTHPDFLLKPNELFEAFSRDLAVVAFEQGEVAEPKPAMMQRLAATKGSGAAIPG